MREDIAQFASFVNRAWGFRGAVTSDTSREGELLEELLEAFFVLSFFWVDLSVRALQIHRCQNPWRAMARPREKNHLKVKFFYQATQMDVHKGQTGACPPMAQEPTLNVLWFQGFA